MPRRPERNIREIPRASNVPPVTEIGGKINDGTTATYVSIIKVTPAGPV